jgi:hypothetical protein
MVAFNKFVNNAFVGRTDVCRTAAEGMLYPASCKAIPDHIGHRLTIVSYMHFFFWADPRLYTPGAFSFCVERTAGTRKLELLTPRVYRGPHVGIENYGRHEETRTPDLYRVKVAL